MEKGYIINLKYLDKSYNIIDEIQYLKVDINKEIK
jgi:hypothetical protein